MSENSQNKLNLPLFLTGVIVDMAGILLVVAAMLGGDYVQFLHDYQWPVGAVGAVLAVSGFLLMNGQLRRLKTPAIVEKRIR